MNYADYICGVNLKERNKMETINIQFQVPSTGQYTRLTNLSPNSKTMLIN